MNPGEEDPCTVYGSEMHSIPMSYYGRDSYSACASDAPYSLGQEPTTFGDAQDHPLTASDDPSYRSSYASCETPWGVASGAASFPSDGTADVTADPQQQPALAGRRRRQRKPKLYNLPEQDDPEEEMRRQRAKREKEKREKRHQDEVNMKRETEKTLEENRLMKVEKELRSCNINMMEQLLAMSESAMYRGQPGAFC